MTTLLGWISVILALSIVPIAWIDPVLSPFAALVSIPLGGLSAIGGHSRLTFAAVAFALSVVGIAIVTHYSPPRGFVVPTPSSLLFATALLAIPGAIALIFVVIGVVKRRRLTEQR